MYHVMSRGVRGLPLYTDDTDRRHFLGLLGEACSRYDWLVYAYCLMGNHYHLLIKTMQANLSRGTQWLNGQYIRWFNRTHDQLGHGIFRRFNAVLITDDAQLATAACYILRNPVRADLSARAADWHWSSYSPTVGAGAAPVYLESTWILGEFGLTLAQAQVNFAAYVNAEE
jgi:putative transposase